MAWGLFADSPPGTDFKERIIHLPYTQAQAVCLLSRHFRRWRCRETACEGQYNEEIRMYFDRCYWSFVYATWRGLEDY